ncbi:hypothetical protein BV22DRAFT_638687 [Leucogyrophana mollusca]|uniref:Uncharacterized protein n=1 Tax=Leucogyrophana mollusca TaxID=85980 RepID=A0ACB8BB82_9AGAM|nr:hypothetical protein BV22DRAFT_638687 [Leucogyrophana mollusca]
MLSVLATLTSKYWTIIVGAQKAHVELKIPGGTSSVSPMSSASLTSSVHSAKVETLAMLSVLAPLPGVEVLATLSVLAHSLRVEALMMLSVLAHSLRMKVPMLRAGPMGNFLFLSASPASAYANSCTGIAPFPSGAAPKARTLTRSVSKCDSPKAARPDFRYDTYYRMD